MPIPKTLSVYDPPMCCSTGVCGAEVDPELVRFSSDLFWLARHGITVNRFNLAQQPEAFVANPAVLHALKHQGETCLPLLANGSEIMSRGSYPSRETLATWFDLTPEADDGLELLSVLGGVGND